MPALIEPIVGDLGDTRRRHRARGRALPASHRTTVAALQRYFTCSDGRWIGTARDRIGAVERAVERAGAHDRTDRS